MESILTTAARRPGREDAPPLTWAEFSRHLRDQGLVGEMARVENFALGDEPKRKLKAAERQRLYNCGGDEDMAEMLASVLEDPTVIQLRREWIAFAKFNNILRRIIGELSTVYSAPAARTVAGPEDNAKYQEVQRLCRQHEVMQRINRLLNLHRALVVMPRMRRLPSGEYVPVIDVITPAKFSLVRDPLDPTLHIGIVFETDFSIATQGIDVPKWVLWTWAESIMFSGAGEAMTDTHRPHELGEIPALLLTLEPPDGRLIDSDTGDDLVAAQKSVWFLGVVHLKEAKSATKQLMLQGDLSRVERDQPDDSQVPLHLGEGATGTTLDRSMDLSMFIRSAQHVYETVAANYGLASSLLNHQGVQSADARELLRAPLRELRAQQQIPFREFERALARLLSIVVAPHRPDLAFSVDGWKIDFADPQTPLGTQEALLVLEKELQLGVTSRQAEMMRRNPDLTKDEAEAVLREFARDNEKWLQWMRGFMALAGGISQGAMTPEARSPDGSLPAPDDKPAQEAA